MRKYYVAEIETSYCDSSLASTSRSILAVLKPDDASMIKKIYETLGYDAAIDMITKYKQVEHRVYETDHSSAFPCSYSTVVVIAREPAVAVVKDSGWQSCGFGCDQAWKRLEFIELKPASKELEKMLEEVMGDGSRD